MKTLRQTAKLITDAIPEKIRHTAFLRLWSLSKVPMINWVRPVVMSLDDASTHVKIPLSWRTRNHLGSMYFGTLCVGADVAGGLMAVRAMSQRKEKFSFVFKDYRAEFLKRPESDVVFTCADGKVIQELVERAAKSGNREELKVLVTATCPKMSKDKVARFELTLSIKKSSK